MMFVLFAIGFIGGSCQQLQKEQGCETQEDGAMLVQLETRRTLGQLHSKGRLEVWPLSTEESQIVKVIDKHFAAVDKAGAGKYLESNRVEDTTWEQCTGIDWSKNPSVAPGTTVFSDMEQELGIAQYCDPIKGLAKDDPTCMAIYAAQGALVELAATFPEGPAFANATVTKWGEYPSFAEGTISKVNYYTPPQNPGGFVGVPAASLLKPAGTTGFALCDIIRTVLTQSANQAGTGTCGWTAFLAALSHKAPAKAIRMAVRLLWTGRATEHMPPTCPSVQQQQPGLLPIMSFKLGQYLPKEVRDLPLQLGDEEATLYVAFDPSAFIDESQCDTALNKADCLVGLRSGRSETPMGLQFEWWASGVSGFTRAFTGDCSTPATQLNQIVDPASKKNMADAQGMLAGHYNWFCERVIDPSGGSCKYFYNKEFCGPIDDATCQSALENMVVPTSLYMKYFEKTGAMAEQGVDPAAIFQAMEKDDNPAAKKITATITNLATDPARAADLWAWLTTVSSAPSGTEAMLRAACTAEVAVLSVWGDAFNRTTFQVDPRPWAPELEYVPCNHAVYMESCDFDKDVFVIWSWAKRFQATKSALLGQPIKAPKIPLPDPSPDLKARSQNTFNSGVLCAVSAADAITA